MSSNFGKRFQNVQSKYAKFNPIKAAVISQAEQAERASTDGSSPRTPTRSPTELTAGSFSAAFATNATEVNVARAGQAVPAPPGAATVAAAAAGTAGGDRSWLTVEPAPDQQQPRRTSGSISRRYGRNSRSNGGSSSSSSSAVRRRSSQQPRGRPRPDHPVRPGGRERDGGATMHKLTTSMFASLRYRRRQRRQAATWKEIVRHNFLQKGKIPLLLAVEAGNQSMCRELLSSQTADQLKVSCK
uniref:Uncharacterized protein n=1 Tax=Anopheles melas TaxID=34690 RepID=A0A182TRY8_9DIPT